MKNRHVRGGAKEVSSENSATMSGRKQHYQRFTDYSVSPYPEPDLATLQASANFYETPDSWQSSDSTYVDYASSSSGSHNTTNWIPRAHQTAYPIATKTQPALFPPASAALVADQSPASSTTSSDYVAISETQHNTGIPGQRHHASMYYDVRTETYKVCDELPNLPPGVLIPTDEVPHEPPQTVPMPSVTNRGKVKRSRKGCLTCRQRKRRCCETKPVCYECQRLSLKCKWPAPGTERKNRSKKVDLSKDEIHHDVYGVIKVLRGVVDHREN